MGAYIKPIFTEPRNSSGEKEIDPKKTVKKGYAWCSRIPLNLLFLAKKQVTLTNEQMAQWTTALKPEPLAEIVNRLWNRLSHSCKSFYTSSIRTASNIANALFKKVGC